MAWRDQERERHSGMIRECAGCASQIGSGQDRRTYPDAGNRRLNVRCNDHPSDGRASMPRRALPKQTFAGQRRNVMRNLLRFLQRVRWHALLTVAALAAATLFTTQMAVAQISDGVVRIGVLGDYGSGRDLGGPG